MEFINGSYYTSPYLKGYYRWESGALTTDSSTAGHTLTAISTPSETTGEYGGGVVFNSVGAYSIANHADFRPTGDFTLGLWFKINDISSGQVGLFQSFSQNTDVAGILIYASSGGTVSFVTGRGTGATPGTDYSGVTSNNGNYDNGKWHSVVITWDGSDVKLYVDGGDVTTISWAYAPGYKSTSYIRFGCRNNSGSNINYMGAYVGCLDDFFILNGVALSADEVTDFTARGINVHDHVATDESGTVLLASDISRSDSVTVTDTLNNALTSNVNVNETSTVSEYSDRTVRDGLQISIWREDTVTVTDIPLFLKAYNSGGITDESKVSEAVTVHISNPSTNTKPTIKVEI